MERVVEDLGSVLDWAAPGEAAVLAGLSFGGLASLHFVLRRPERVRGLLLVDSGPGFKKPEAQARWEASVEKTAAYLERKGMEPFVASRAVTLLVGTRPELPEARAALRAIAEQDPTGLARFGRGIAGPVPGVIDELAGIDVPALVMVGEHDAAYLRAAEVMEARLPRAELVVIPGGHHIVNIEESEAFDAAALRFLTRLRDGAL
jgi:pimeloyl-ACP methyl ester carboxylesterase